MPLYGNRDQYSDAPKNPVNDKAETGSVQFGNTVFGVSANEVTAIGGKGSHAGWVRRTVGTGGRAGRVFYETLVAGSILLDATAGAGNTTATANSTGTSDDVLFPDV